jgi:hypothetical protein
MNDQIVDVTTKISIYTQFAVGIFNVYGLTVTISEKNLLLKDILWLEFIVAIIEFCWYYFLIQKLPQEEMAKIRYYDWLISTPLMLVSMFSYLLYEEQLEKNSTEPLRLPKIIQDYSESIIQIIISNYAMLYIGYLYEIDQIKRNVAFAYGFLFLVNTFNIIYKQAGSKSNRGKVIFLIAFLLWSIYGIAFIMSTKIKNTIFNIVDLFSKNFLQVYITLMAINKKE